MLDCKEATALESFSLRVKNVRDDAGLRRWLADLIKTSSMHTMEISPAMATVMLERNTGNRTLSKIRAAHYAKEMTAGNWWLAGEPIIFSKEGILNDGQTRLRACVEADVSFRSDVRFGIEREAFHVTGTGAKRSLSDVFSIMGEKCTTRLAGSLCWVSGYLKGDPSNRRLSAQAGIAMLEEHPDIRKSIDAVSTLYSRSRLMEPSLSVFLHYIFALKDTDKADAFFQFLTDGIGASNAKDPRLLLRERLIANGASKAKLSSIDIAALTIKAWNGFRSGKPVGTLKWVDSEPFPRAQ